MQGKVTLLLVLFGTVIVTIHNPPHKRGVGEVFLKFLLFEDYKVLSNPSARKKEHPMRVGVGEALPIPPYPLCRQDPQVSSRTVAHVVQTRLTRGRQRGF